MKIIERIKGMVRRSPNKIDSQGGVIEQVHPLLIGLPDYLRMEIVKQGNELMVGSSPGTLVSNPSRIIPNDLLLKLNDDSNVRVTFEIKAKGE